MKKHEALSSLRECGKDGSKKSTKYGISGMAVPDSTMIYPYWDTAARPNPVWTIGWGSTFLKNGSRVTESTRLTKKECDELFDYMSEFEFGKWIRDRLKVPVTQSMFDAMVSIAYNAGSTGFTSSKAFSALNAGDYAACSALIPETRATTSFAKARRIKERALFDSEGYP
jgi:lysozyme